MASRREMEVQIRLQAMDRTGPAFKRVSGKMRQMERDGGRTMSAHRRTAAASTSAIGASAAALARFAGPAVVGLAAKASIDAARDMENALFEIEKKSGATKGELADIRSEINDLASELPVSISEIAKAFERGAAAGIPLEDLKQFAKLTNQVADSWDGVDAEGVANYFAGFQDVLKIPKDELETFADLINGLADSGISDEGDIAQFIDRVGASLQNFGMGTKDIAALGAAMIDLKMPAEIAARAMDTLTGKLGAPENLSKKSRSALSAIVGDLDEFAKLSGDAKIMTFFEKVDGLSGQRKISLVGALMGEGFDDEILRAVSGLETIKKHKDYAADESNYKGTIAGLSEKKLELFDSKMQLFRTSLNQVGQAFGANMTGPLGSALETITNINLEISKATMRQSEASAAAKRAEALTGEGKSQLLSDFETAREARGGKDVWNGGGVAIGMGAGDLKKEFEEMLIAWSASETNLGAVQWWEAQQDAAEAISRAQEYPTRPPDAIGPGPLIAGATVGDGGPTVPTFRSRSDEREKQAVAAQYALYGAGQGEDGNSPSVAENREGQGRRSLGATIAPLSFDTAKADADVERVRQLAEQPISGTMQIDTSQAQAAIAARQAQADKLMQTLQAATNLSQNAFTAGRPGGVARTPGRSPAGRNTGLTMADAGGD